MSTKPQFGRVSKSWLRPWLEGLYSIAVTVFVVQTTDTVEKTFFVEMNLQEWQHNNRGIDVYHDIVLFSTLRQ